MANGTTEDSSLAKSQFTAGFRRIDVPPNRRLTIACTGAGGRAGFKWRVATASPVMRRIRQGASVTSTDAFDRGIAPSSTVKCKSSLPTTRATAPGPDGSARRWPKPEPGNASLTSLLDVLERDGLAGSFHLPRFE